MADRDLLHKPSPLVKPEGDDKSAAPPAPARGRLGVAERPREVAREADAQAVGGKSSGARQPGPAGTPDAAGTRPGAAADPSTPTGAPAPAPKAFRNAYFNKDVAATGALNQRTREMAALRGQEGAADLRRVVLPHPPGAENPSPQDLHGALARMGGAEAEGTEFTELLGRQAAWTRREGVTPEAIAAAQAKLAALVELRRAALQRMRALPPSHLEAAPSLGQAVVAADAGAQPPPDPEAEAEALVHANARRGAGMRRRLAKVMGSKR